MLAQQQETHVHSKAENVPLHRAKTKIHTGRGGCERGDWLYAGFRDPNWRWKEEEERRGSVSLSECMVYGYGMVKSGGRISIMIVIMIITIIIINDHDDKTHILMANIENKNLSRLT